LNICPISYEPCGNNKYSQKGVKLLGKNISTLNSLPLSQEEQLQEAASRSDKMSIQGVQPKLSAILDTSKEIFEIVDRGGRYILKPQNNFYPELPENESLTMKLAEKTGIEVPVNGMVYSSDERLTYFIKRFDRYGRNKKLAIEDFAQLAQKTRETKYDYSMEKLITIIDEFCTFPVIEKTKLFKLVIFNFLVGNEDMHLKNYSLINRDNKTELSPAYDLLNTTIAVANAEEEIALPLAGKKRNLTRNDLLAYLGKDRLHLNDTVIVEILDGVNRQQSTWETLIQNSFLSSIMKEKYSVLMSQRWKIVF